jgi:hypothetical protein
MAHIITDKQFSEWLKESLGDESEAEKAKRDHEKRKWEGLFNGPDAQPAAGETEDAPPRPPPRRGAAELDDGEDILNRP